MHAWQPNCSCSVDQIATPSGSSIREERRALFAALKEQASIPNEAGWGFWDDASEEIYNNLIPGRPANR